MMSLHVDSIQKSFDEKVLLTDIFLSCEIGHIKGVLGRNGSGKSTLLKIIFGSESAQNKFVKVGGKIIKNIFDTKGLINYLPQDNFLPENIKIKTLINHFIHKNCRKRLIDNEYIQQSLNKKSKELSFGERRVVEILFIIHSSAKFVLLDEPFNGVGPIIREYISNYIRETKPTKGYIITDHDYQSVLDLSDSISFLKDGVLHNNITDREQLVNLGYIPPSKLNR